MYDIMNRSSSKDSLIGAGGGRNHTNHINHNATTNGILPHRRPMSFTKNNAAENFNNNNNSNMDLFSRNRTSLPLANSDESDLQVRLARLSVGSAKPAKSILDDMLSSNEGGKHDYDWLLTPPGTPLFPTSDTKGSQPTPVTARSRSSVRSSSTNKTSRLSVSQSESNHPSRPTRSSSVTRSSISSTQYTNYSSRNTNILNTSSASVSSYIRPSTPTNRSSSTTTRISTPSTRTTPSPRASTPSRTRPSSTTTSSIERPTRPSQNSRPSTPSSRPQTPGNLTSPTIRPPSRPSTPTRRTLTPSLSPSTPSLSSSGRGLSSNGRNVGSTSRPSSPSPRVRPPTQPINLHDFPHETPPNLRTTLPDRPLSAGRSRPVVKGNMESSNTASITRRHSSPIVSRGRIAEPPGRGRPHANGHVVESLEGRRTSQLPESLTRRPIKSSSAENGTGFGRNISKKSLDMAIKHMDIRNGGARPISGSTLFPQSIRSANSRTQPGRAISAPGSVDGENGNYTWNNRGVIIEDQSPHSSKLSSEVDIYESSRYDAILLKEDLKNTSWLHSADDKIGDESPLFDNGFETLPEPFGPL